MEDNGSCFRISGTWELSTALKQMRQSVYRCQMMKATM